MEVIGKSLIGDEDYVDGSVELNRALKYLIVDCELELVGFASEYIKG